MLIQSKPSHWYEVKGDTVLPCYQLNKVNGSGVKQPTLADAKKLGLWPSVTNILGIFDKPGLDNWKLEQAILAARTLPLKPGETEDQFCHRIVEDMDAEAGKAADFGTQIHAAISDYPNEPLNRDLIPFIAPVFEWLKDKGNLLFEQIVAGNGYAGRRDLRCLDADGIPCVVDFKTQRVKNGKPAFYNEWPLQLAAYGAPIMTPEPRLISIVIDSQTPGTMFVQQWERPLEYYLGLFSAAFKLWIYQKEYDPRKFPQAIKTA